MGVFFDMLKSVLFFLLLSSSLFALPVGNPAEASLICDGVFWDRWINCCGTGNPCCVDWWERVSIRVGYKGNFVYQRAFETDDNGKDFEDFSMANNTAVLTLNYFEWLDLFGTFGAARFALEGNASIFGGPSGSRLLIETGTDTSWSIGGRITLFRCKSFYVGLEGEIFGTNPHIFLVSLGESLTLYLSHSAHLPYREGTVALGTSFCWGTFFPFANLKWSKVKIAKLDAPIDIGPISTRFSDLKNKQSIGCTLGVTYLPCRAMALTLEGCFIDELTLGFNATIRI